jgi:hypothetical protein
MRQIDTESLLIGDPADFRQSRYTTPSTRAQEDLYTGHTLRSQEGGFSHTLGGQSQLGSQYGQGPSQPLLGGLYDQPATSGYYSQQRNTPSYNTPAPPSGGGYYPQYGAYPPSQQTFPPSHPLSQVPTP